MFQCATEPMSWKENSCSEFNLGDVRLKHSSVRDERALVHPLEVPIIYDVRTRAARTTKPIQRHASYALNCAGFFYTSSSHRVWQPRDVCARTMRSNHGCTVNVRNRQKPIEELIRDWEIHITYQQDHLLPRRMWEALLRLHASYCWWGWFGCCYCCFCWTWWVVVWSNRAYT